MEAHTRTLAATGWARKTRILFLSTTLLGACSRSEPEVPAAATPVEASKRHVPLPDRVEVPVPDAPIVDIDVVEDSSEAVANSLVELADKLRRRDFQAAREWFATDFVGQPWAPLAVATDTTLPLGASKRRLDVAAAPVVDRDGFLEALRTLIGPWKHVEWVTPKVKAAEFQSGLPAWGRVRQQWTFLGTAADGGPRSVVVWAWTRVQSVSGRWTITHFALESIDETARPRPLFTDVASSVGLARAGIRFGRPGNQSFAWNGAAAGDVNGDGAVDLFVPATPANFLYVTQPEGGFRDEAEARGLARPAGGTGAAFLDFDNDDDLDLIAADVGWRDGDDAGGNPLRLYVNDGKGHFEEKGVELGIGDLCHGYSVTVFDADRDGFLDVYVCNYGRVDAEPNNSWVQATNGTPDRFYRNLAGKGFHEEAAERGLSDHGWSYASAAADFDADGDLDLYVANDYGVNALYVNDGSGHFTDRAAELGVQDLGNGMGVTWGDLDADGRLDLYVSNMSSTAGKRILSRMKQQGTDWKDLSKMASGNSIFLNRGATFERLPGDKGGIGGSWAWAPALFDLDNDGDLDVYCCSGYVTGDTAADT
jgi:hypothetical protein